MPIIRFKNGNTMLVRPTAREQMARDRIPLKPVGLSASAIRALHRSDQVKIEVQEEPVPDGDGKSSD